jgi:hypothetical protein
MSLCQIAGIGALSFAGTFAAVAYFHETPEQKLDRQFTEFTQNIQAMSKLYVESRKNHQNYWLSQLEKCIRHGDEALALYADVKEVALPEQREVALLMRNACVHEWNRR